MHSAMKWCMRSAILCVQAECERALLEGCEILMTNSEELREALVMHLSMQCCALLAPVRALKASFRMTGRALPSTHSYFVSEVMQPLRDCFRAFGNQLPPKQHAQWAFDVSAHVTKHYLSLASTLLDTMRKNEDALRRLNAKKATPSGSQVNDSHKICVQLFLDVTAFGKQLSDLGVQTTQLPEYAQLEDTVHPKLMGSVGEAEWAPTDMDSTSHT